MFIVKMLVLIIKAFISLVFMGLHKHYLFQTKDQDGTTMTKLYSLVVLYKGDSAAHILKVFQAGLVS